MFSLPHLSMILLTALLVPLCCKWARTWQKQTVDRFFKVMAVAVLFFDPTYWMWELLTRGRIDLAGSLPLYVCSLFWLLLPLAVYSREGVVRRCAQSCLCTACLLGGVMGMIFNSHVGRHPFFTFVPLYSMFYHFMLILVISLLWVTRYYRPKPVDRWLCMLPVVALVLVDVVLNRRYGWDYCFTAGGPGTPLALVSSRVPQMVFLLLLYGGMALLIGWGFYSWFFRRQEAGQEQNAVAVAEDG